MLYNTNYPGIQSDGSKFVVQASVRMRLTGVTDAMVGGRSADRAKSLFWFSLPTSTFTNRTLRPKCSKLHNFSSYDMYIMYIIHTVIIPLESWRVS